MDGPHPEAIGYVSLYIEACQLEARIITAWISGHLYLEEFEANLERVKFIKTAALERTTLSTRIRAWEAGI